MKALLNLKRKKINSKSIIFRPDISHEICKAFNSERKWSTYSSANKIKLHIKSEMRFLEFSEKDFQITLHFFLYKQIIIL